MRSTASAMKALPTHTDAVQPPFAGYPQKRGQQRATGRTPLRDWTSAIPSDLLFVVAPTGFEPVLPP